MSSPKEGSINYWDYDGTIEQDDGFIIPSLIFTLLLAGCIGAFFGVLITMSITESTIKQHYCVQYTNVQEYLTCKALPLQEIYALMEKH